MTEAEYLKIRPVLDLISRETSAWKENGLDSPYDAPFGYGVGPKSLKPNKPLTQMTIGEVMEYQDRLRVQSAGFSADDPNAGTTAVGKYQFMKETLLGLLTNLKGEINENTVFDARVQERLALSLLGDAGVDKWMKDERSNEEFTLKLGRIWPSISKADGTAHYPGQHILTHFDEMATVLDEVKSNRAYVPGTYVHNKPDITLRASQRGQTIPEQTAAKLEAVASTEDLSKYIEENGKYYERAYKPAEIKRIYDEGFSSSRATFDFDKALQDLGDAPENKDMRESILKIRENLGDSNKIKVNLKGDNINWQWEDPSLRLNRFSGVDTRDQRKLFKGKGDLGLKGTKYDKVLNYLVSGDYLQHEQPTEMVEYKGKEYIPQVAAVVPGAVDASGAPLATGTPLVTAPADASLSAGTDGGGSVAAEVVAEAASPEQGIPNAEGQAQNAVVAGGAIPDAQAVVMSNPVSAGETHEPGVQVLSNPQRKDIVSEFDDSHLYTRFPGFSEEEFKDNEVLDFFAAKPVTKGDKYRPQFGENSPGTLLFDKTAGKYYMYNNVGSKTLIKKYNPILRDFEDTTESDYLNRALNGANSKGNLHEFLKNSSLEVLDRGERTYSGIKRHVPEGNKSYTLTSSDILKNKVSIPENVENPEVFFDPKTRRYILNQGRDSYSSQDGANWERSKVSSVNEEGNPINPFIPSDRPQGAYGGFKGTRTNPGILQSSFGGQRSHKSGGSLDTDDQDYFDEFYKAQALYTKALANKYQGKIPVMGIMKKYGEIPEFSHSNLGDYAKDIYGEHGEFYLEDSEIQELVAQGYPDINKLKQRITSYDAEHSDAFVGTRGTKEDEDRKFGVRNMLQRAYRKGDKPYAILNELEDKPKYWFGAKMLDIIKGVGKSGAGEAVAEKALGNRAGIASLLDAGKNIPFTSSFDPGSLLEGVGSENGLTSSITGILSGDGNSGNALNKAVNAATTLPTIQGGKKASQTGEGDVKVEPPMSGMEKLLGNVDLKAIVNYAGSKPTRSNPVKKEVAAMANIAVPTVNTGITTEAQRMAEQHLVDSINYSPTNSNPDDVGASVGKAKAVSDLIRGSHATMADFKLASEREASTAAIKNKEIDFSNQNNFLAADYANKAADEAADTRAEVLEQNRMAQFAADTLSTVSNRKATASYMDMQEKVAISNREISGLKKETIMAQNTLQALRNALAMNPTDKNLINQESAAQTAFDLANDAYDIGLEKAQTSTLNVRKRNAMLSAGNSLFKKGGSIQKEKIKAEARIKIAEMKESADRAKELKRDQIRSHREFRKATELVKKSNEILLRSYFKR